MELILIRHGLTRANFERRFCGKTDWPLLPESLTALDQLAQSGALTPVQVVCHTGLLRTIQTAERLFPGVPTLAAPALAEFDFGDFETLTHEDLKDNPDYVRWLDEFATMACPNGENQIEFQDRIRRGWQDLVASWAAIEIEKAALVTHGGVIAVLMNDWFPGDRALLDWQPDCGAGYRVSFSTGCPMLVQSFGARKI